MSNGYKAPSGLGSAVRGRSMVRRDYTAGVKADRQERLAEEAVVQSGLGLVQGIAGGVAQLSSAIGENIKSWEQAEAGARTVFEGSGLEGTFEESGYQGADNWMDRWFKSAGEEVKTQTIGGKEFSVADLMNVGRADSVAATRMGTAIRDESGTITGYKSLYESIGLDTETAAGGITSTTTSPPVESKTPEITQPEDDGSKVIKNNNQQQQKQNATGGQPPEQDDGIIGGAENLPPKLKEQYDASVKGTKPMKGEKFRAYRDRLRTMGLDPSARDKEGNLLYPHTRYEDL